MESSVRNRSETGGRVGPQDHVVLHLEKGAGTSKGKEGLSIFLMLNNQEKNMYSDKHHEVFERATCMMLWLQSLGSK